MPRCPTGRASSAGARETDAREAPAPPRTPPDRGTGREHEARASGKVRGLTCFSGTLQTHNDVGPRSSVFRNPPGPEN